MLFNNCHSFHKKNCDNVRVCDGNSLFSQLSQIFNAQLRLL